MKKSVLIGVVLMLAGICLFTVGKELNAINAVGFVAFVAGIVVIVKGFVSRNKEKAPKEAPAPGVKKLKPGKRLNVFDNRLTQINDIEQILSLQDYVVLDVETTGLDPAAERIIEIAALKVEGGIPTGRYETLVDPGKKLPPNITELTGLTTEQVRAGKQYQTMVEETESFVGSLPIIAHNSSFDAKFLSAAFVYFGRYGDFTHIDTVALAKKAFPEMPNYKLATLIQQLQLSDHPQTHRAMDDVECTQKLFDRCRGVLRAKASISGELRQAENALSALGNAKTTVDVFLAYEQASTAIESAKNKDPESTALLFGDDGKYLEKYFSRPVSEAIDRDYEQEKKAVQKLKTRRAILSHIEKYKTVFDTNAEKLTDAQKRKLSEREKELLHICDMIAPE